MSINNNSKKIKSNSENNDEVFLRKFKQELSILLKNSPVLILFLDKSGKITYIKFPNYDEDKLSLIGKNYLSILDPLFKDQFKTNFKSVLKNKQSISFEAKLKFPDKQKYYFHLTIANLEAKNHFGEIVIFGSNISDCIISKSELQKREYYLKEILHTMPAGVVIIDPTTCKISYINQRALELTGYTEKELLGANCKKTLCLNRKNCEYLNSKTKVFKVEEKLYSKNGQHKIVLKTIKKIDIFHKTQIIETFIDISALKSTQKDLEIKIKKLEMFNELAINRELKMIELKKEINQLSQEIGISVPYNLEDF